LWSQEDVMCPCTPWSREDVICPCAMPNNNKLLVMSYIQPVHFK